MAPTALFKNLRAIVGMTTEKHGLSSVIPETVPFQPGKVSTLSVKSSDASLEILRNFKAKNQDLIDFLQ